MITGISAPKTRCFKAAHIEFASFHPQGSKPAFSTEVEGGIPIVIDKANWGRDADHPSEFTLRNDSQSNMVAYEVVWQLRFGDQVLEIPETFDGWLVPTENHLHPGENKTAQFNLSATSPEGYGPDRVTLALVYAEFEDGARLGPEAAKLGGYLDKSRGEALGFYKDFLAAYQSRGQTGATAFLLSTKEMGGRATAQSILRFYLETNGINGVLATVRSKLNATK